MSEFDESEHNRDKGDKFVLKGLGMIVKEPRSIANLLGQEYKGIKGQKAINRLLQEKQGHVKGAFSRVDVGDIDLIWGNDKIGLQHIINQRTEQGIELVAFFACLTDTIEDGELVKSKRGNFEIRKGRQLVVVQPEFKGNKFNFVVTAYKTREKTLSK